ncbi:helix-turn-helix domain-containing protein [Reyranella sp. CPCC 100927]|uniref:helix-turn-helix domain-containing protein n=1 Tax=Reyranella sp. CPCC 100927 TaxID=2599616 RepID=UPI0011B61C76|nr:helix-turn-helix domain-containing protein [Reyranella sp. CPCC 100927]TWS99826.1 AraC family transcriptional regulator [Reyranella sp. CPCC 100927]
MVLTVDSPRYLNKLFASEDTSVARFIWEERLQRAARMLGNPARLPITTVGLDSGFSTMSHFSRAFRDRFGLSPRGYRAQRSQ